MRVGNRARWLAIGWGVAAVCALGLASPALASTVELNFQYLEIDGDPNDDAISVSTDGTTLTITDTGTGGLTNNDVACTQVNPNTVTCPVNPVGEPAVIGFFVDLNSGADSFTNHNFVTEFGQVYAFNETGVKRIAGGPGSQSLYGGLDSDVLDGGDGDDFLADGSNQSTVGNPTAGNDDLVGGAGEDEAGYFRSAASAMTITLDGIANDGAAGEADNVQVENVTLGDSNDVLVGDDGANVLSGGGGSDRVTGLKGNDQLFGDGGDGMLVRGGGSLATGDDTLDGGKGRDGLDCGRGFDVALREPLDQVEANCERIGADVAGDSATVSGKKKNKLKVEIACPEAELETCSGKLKITTGGKKIGKGKFSVASGKTKRAKAKLTKKGVKSLRKAGGSLLVTVLATTAEPGGVARDDGRILIHR